MLDAVTSAPMWVRVRMDCVAANPLGRELDPPMCEGPANKGNTARPVFPKPAAVPDGVIGEAAVLAGASGRGDGFNGSITKLRDEEDEEKQPATTKERS
ncbi:hypothetical protein KNN17_13425 [Arthrobacter bambusae]|uniref:hypothetical protein n=1 Tax=Arthrobacter bambusae TaxID=1338426 RepID=UPI001F508252|nr:hypothetical protein [Arthrobacter bambusae]MCI0142579.1 hypothetical protein [Arthrobacter bambusae]